MMEQFPKIQKMLDSRFNALVLANINQKIIEMDIFKNKNLYLY